MVDELRRRPAAAVFEDHLRLAGEHRFEEDIERNVSPNIAILERRGVFRGRERAKELARLLEHELPQAPYVYTNRMVEGRVCEPSCRPSALERLPSEYRASAS